MAISWGRARQPDPLVEWENVSALIRSNTNAFGRYHFPLIMSSVIYHRALSARDFRVTRVIDCAILRNRGSSTGKIERPTCIPFIKVEWQPITIDPAAAASATTASHWMPLWCFYPLGVDTLESPTPPIRGNHSAVVQWLVEIAATACAACQGGSVCTLHQTGSTGSGVSGVIAFEHRDGVTRFHEADAQTADVSALSYCRLSPEEAGTAAGWSLALGLSTKKDSLKWYSASALLYSNKELRGTQSLCFGSRNSLRFLRPLFDSISTRDISEAEARDAFVAEGAEAEAIKAACVAAAAKQSGPSSVGTQGSYPRSPSSPAAAAIGVQPKKRMGRPPSAAKTAAAAAAKRAAGVGSAGPPAKRPARTPTSAAAAATVRSGGPSAADDGGAPSAARGEEEEAAVEGEGEASDGDGEGGGSSDDDDNGSGGVGDDDELQGAPGGEQHVWNELDEHVLVEGSARISPAAAAAASPSLVPAVGFSQLSESDRRELALRAQLDASDKRFADQQSRYDAREVEQRARFDAKLEATEAKKDVALAQRDNALARARAAEAAVEELKLRNGSLEAQLQIQRQQPLQQQPPQGQFWQSPQLLPPPPPQQQQQQPQQWGPPAQYQQNQQPQQWAPQQPQQQWSSYPQQQQQQQWPQYPPQQQPPQQPPPPPPPPPFQQQQQPPQQPPVAPSQQYQPPHQQQVPFSPPLQAPHPSQSTAPQPPPQPYNPPQAPPPQYHQPPASKPPPPQQQALQQPPFIQQQQQQQPPPHLPSQQQQQPLPQQQQQPPPHITSQ